MPKTGLLLGSCLLLTGCFQSIQTYHSADLGSVEAAQSAKNATENAKQSKAMTFKSLKTTETFQPYHTTLQHSPWGNAIKVKVQQQYHAASGQLCLQLTELPQGQTALICSGDGQHWQQTRNF